VYPSFLPVTHSIELFWNFKQLKFSLDKLEPMTGASIAETNSDCNFHIYKMFQPVNTHNATPMHLLAFEAILTEKPDCTENHSSAFLWMRGCVECGWL
jgi:hypothetical protein